MNMASKDSPDGTWLTAESANFEQFKADTQTATAQHDWPHASEVVKNVLVYDGALVREAAQSKAAGQALTAEWARALKDGPGIIAIRNAIADAAIVDRATHVFENLIDQEKREAIGGGDHFAKPGANDRVWNAAQKHCLADPENFAEYYASSAIALASLAWLGPNYQLTSQVNRVNPGGAAQSAHRDYHLGFMDVAQALKYPAACHQLSPFLTLQGAVAHCDMPLDTGPTKLLPYSQKFSHGYAVFGLPDYQDYFEEKHVQLELHKGDAMFFNPATMHAAGANRTTNVHRMANLLQIGSAFGRTLEAMDRIAMAKALYPVLLDAHQGKKLNKIAIDHAIAACAEGYPFPTSLDTDPPVGGLVPQSQADFMRQALSGNVDSDTFCNQLDAMEAKRRPN